MNKPVLSVLIPAAGSSERLGQAKQLVHYKGQTLLQNAVSTARSVAPSEIIVVTGANADAVKESVRASGIHWVHNPNWQTGMGGSIASGCAAIETQASGVMILLCDQWRISENDLGRLVNTWKSTPGHIVASELDGQLLPPVIFPSSCFNQLKKLQGDKGARSLFKPNEEMLITVPMDNAAFDLDTQSQLAQLKDSKVQ